MPAEPVWLTAEQVIVINAREVAATNENHFVRDRGALESAVMRPRNRFDILGVTDLAELTASMVAGLAWSHAFEQGNKRTASTAGLLFARLNGSRFVPIGEDEQGFMVESLTIKAVSEANYADFLRMRLFPIS